MQTVTIEFPGGILIATGQSREEFIRDAKLILATRLFELGRLSSGKAAEFCGLDRVAFILQAGARGVPVADLDDDEMSREFDRG
jgi:predicted HTH domain antitoxin